MTLRAPKPLSAALERIWAGLTAERVSLVTAIKDRSESLEAVFETWVRIPGVDRIVIVDWSSKDSSAIERVAKRDKRVLVARVENERYFNHTRTKNLGVSLTHSETVIVTDADIKIDRRLSRLVSALRGNDRQFFRAWIPGGYGTIVVRREKFDAVGGYDERMEGWGGSDDDLYLRLTLNGIAFVNIPEGLLTHIDHPEEARHVNMMIQGRKESQAANADIVRQNGLWSKAMHAAIHKPIAATLWSSSAGGR